jgi:hypothetical protein
MHVRKEYAMKAQQKRNQSQALAPDQREQQADTQTKPAHMNQGTQTFRPDKQKKQEMSKQRNAHPRKAS